MKAASNENDNATKKENCCLSPVPENIEINKTPCRHNSHQLTMYEIRLRRKLERHYSTLATLSPLSSSSDDSVLSSINTLSPSCDERLKRANIGPCHGNNVPSASSPIGTNSLMTVASKSRIDSLLETNLLSMHLNSTSDKTTGAACSTWAVLSPTSTSKTPCKSNPFEVDLLSTIHLPSFSPSVFSQIATPSKINKDNFHWSVDNLSAIYPADIQIPEQDNGHNGPDRETEEHVQKAINEFFAQHVMPSPWLQQNSANHNKSKPKSFSPQFDDIAEGSAPETCQNTPGGSTRHAWTQTTLSLPAAFDMHKVLAPYYTFNSCQKRQGSETRDNSNGEIDTNIIESSIPSLRRKLFVGDYEDSAATAGDDNDHKPLKKCHVTPEKPLEPSLDTDTPNLFSSSPITHRTSVVPTSYCSPPPLSPIETNKYQVRGSQTPHLAESMICSPHVCKEMKGNVQETFLTESCKQIFDESGVFTPGIDNHNAVRFLLDTPKYVHMEPMAIDQSELKSVSFMDTSEGHPGFTGTSQDNGYLTGSLQYNNVNDVTNSGSSAGVRKVSKDPDFIFHKCTPLIP